MAGPDSFFLACLSIMGRAEAWLLAEGELHKHAKEVRGQHPAILTEQAWLIKDMDLLWIMARG